MSSAFRSNLKMAFGSVRMSKWRSFLTMLGIIIGVTSVVSVVSIGEGVKNQVGSQVDQLGRDLITVRPGDLVRNQSGTSVGGINLLSNSVNLGALVPDDVRQITSVAGVDKAVPLSVVNGAVTVGNNTYSPLVLATTKDLPDVVRRGTAYGDFFDVDVSREPNVAVIGSDVANKLFKQRVPLGQTFTFLGQQFVVRGILNKFDTAPLTLNTDFNNTIFIPSSTAKDLTNDSTQLFEVLVKPKDSTQANHVADDIERTLTQAHHGQQQFTVLRQNQSMAVTNNILSLMTRLIAGIAAISLLVGGIGIMNVMLVSVTERMHEIGIRKAIGATNRQIMMQFLTESAVLSTIGGVIGVLLSFVVNFLLRSFTDLTPQIDWWILGAATLLSLFVGVIFGTAPALKAARKDPIHALRNE